MRVSKTVCEYIEEQVRAKMEIKYRSALDEETAMHREAEAFHSEMIEAIGNLMESMTAKEIERFPFLQVTTKDLRTNLSYHIRRTVEVIPTTNVRQQMNKEIDAIVKNIIITLELGGIKADLERMLTEIV